MKITTKRVPHLALAALAISIALAGCASTAHAGGVSGSAGHTAASDGASAKLKTEYAALSKYVAASQSKLSTVVTSSNGIYSDFRMKAVYPDTIEYDYYYAKPIDPAAATKYFDGMLPTFQSVLDGQVFPGMRSVGVTTSQHAVYTYYGSDGTKLWAHTFAPAKK